MGILKKLWWKLTGKDKTANIIPTRVYNPNHEQVQKEWQEVEKQLRKSRKGRK